MQRYYGSQRLVIECNKLDVFDFRAEKKFSDDAMSGMSRYANILTQTIRTLIIVACIRNVIFFRYI
jgi:hypothetical protein